MMHTSCKTILLGLIAASALTSHSTYSATVSTVGSFNDPTASSMYFYNRIYNQDDSASPAHSLPNNLNASTDSVAYFGWGVDVAESFVNRQIIQSHFWFNGVGSVDGGAAASVPYGSAFSLGSFTYTNEETILSGGIVNIDFQLNINVDGFDLFPVEYRLQIDNTSNQLANSSDTARLIGIADDISFMLGGNQYLLSFNGFSRDGGLTFESIATLPENQQTSAEIFATITAVPVPAAIWLMGSGLLALVGFARSKK